jgi:hypothetical protein
MNENSFLIAVGNALILNRFVLIDGSCCLGLAAIQYRNIYKNFVSRSLWTF